MEYFFYCRDKPNSGALRKQIVQTHWSFMDAYSSAFVARGPTLSEDGVSQTGSMPIVDLPDAEAVRVAKVLISTCPGITYVSGCDTALKCAPSHGI